MNVETIRHIERVKSRQSCLAAGGNGGIGRGIALGLAEAGASVAVLGRTKRKTSGCFPN